MNQKINTRSLSVAEAEKLVVENLPRRNVWRPRPTVVLVEGQACVEIQLTKGRHCIVDAGRYVEVSPFNWHASGLPNEEYAARRDHSKNMIVLMHRQLLGFPKEEGDHENGDRLDNRSCNLRVATRVQNGANIPARSKTGFKGVTQYGNRFVACIKHLRKSRYLGQFSNPSDAARKYDSEAIKIWGRFARLNFPLQAVSIR